MILTTASVLRLPSGPRKEMLREDVSENTKPIRFTVLCTVCKQVCTYLELCDYCSVISKHKYWPPGQHQSLLQDMILLDTVTSG